MLLKDKPDIFKKTANMNNLFKNTRILVVGDVILDRYFFGEINRISPKPLFQW